nr:MAG TPA: hypothetical protein [Caudoviricetes sp.]
MSFSEILKCSQSAATFLIDTFDKSFSQALYVVLETPTALAVSACVSFFLARNSFNVYFMLPPPLLISSIFYLIIFQASIVSFIFFQVFLSFNRVYLK